MEGIDIEAAAATFWANAPPINDPVRAAVLSSLQLNCVCTPHTPQPNAVITPSILCPPVLTSDQLLLWTTQAGQFWQDELELKLPNSIIFKLFQVMVKSLDQDTHSNYGAGLLCFTQFCDSTQILEEDRMPASEPLLSAFAASYASTVSDKTLNNWLAGLHYWHIINNATWNVETLANNYHYSNFHIPWTKTTKEMGADISITERKHCTCPLHTLGSHTVINADIPNTAPLFSYKTPNGWLPLTKPHFMSRCNEVWVSQGYPDMPRHAFRISGTTKLLLQGISPDIIATQGRWASQAFLQYWRRIETVLPLFISSSSDVARLHSIDSVMDNFSRKNNLPCTHA
ncbi:hypothetical protein PAXRUDRAFT_18099 [Paxillus rubicundulus Ve08.2h10]|uniref:Uncharacterized protein n=1 Tax=Paxillus rubicundulus Ve08.2h10 TaxID=930991 RepID=A0A0D0DFM1_9AGAM|nr:hypothetical protein PAXRUDRAFT_18099 [Paxillus rubicundulus Ve08.2h10]